MWSTAEQKGCRSSGLQSDDDEDRKLREKGEVRVKEEDARYTAPADNGGRRNKEDTEGISARTTTMPVLFYASCVGDPLVRINCVGPDRPRWPNPRLKLSIDTMRRTRSLPYPSDTCPVLFPRAS